MSVNQFLNEQFYETWFILTISFEVIVRDYQNLCKADYKVSK